jgi:hypothetical protein
MELVWPALLCTGFCVMGAIGEGEGEGPPKTKNAQAAAPDLVLV